MKFFLYPTSYFKPNIFLFNLIPRPANFDSVQIYAFEDTNPSKSKINKIQGENLPI